MVEPDASLSGVLDVTCHYCGKKVTKQIKCFSCYAVFHRRCTEKQICCEGPALYYIEEDPAQNASIYSPHPTQCMHNPVVNYSAQYEEIYVQNLIFENDMLRKLVHEFESKEKVLQHNIVLLTENKKLLEDKLDTLEREIRQESPIDDTYKEITKLDNSLDQPKPSTSKEINHEYRQEYPTLPKLSTDDDKIKNLESEHRKIVNQMVDVYKCVDQHNKVKSKKLRSPENKKSYGEGYIHDQNFAVERMAWLYLYRIKRHIREEDIKNFIMSQEKFKGANIEVKELPTNENKSKCFMFGITWSFRDEVYKPTTWPRSVGFKRFDFHKYREYEDNKPVDFV